MITSTDVYFECHTVDSFNKLFVFRSTNIETIYDYLMSLEESVLVEIRTITPMSLYTITKAVETLRNNK